MGIYDVVKIFETNLDCFNNSSFAEFIRINSILYYILEESCVLAAEHTATTEQWKSYSHMCQVNLDTAIANMPLILPPTTDNVQALLFAVWSFFILSFFYTPSNTLTSVRIS